MRYFLINPDDPDQWEIETEEPQVQHVELKDYQEISEDDVIKLALELEQETTELGLELTDGLEIDILYDLWDVYDHLDNIIKMVKYGLDVSVKLHKIGTLTFEYQQSTQSVKMSLKSNSQHAKNFLLAVEGLFPQKIEVERVVEREN